MLTVSQRRNRHDESWPYNVRRRLIPPIWRRALHAMRTGASGRFAVAAVLLLAAGPSPALSQSTAKSLAERLGYPHDAKLVMIHADDLGMTHSVNAASIKALETGLVNSASMMVPCPWFPEIADYAKAHPDADLGLHLTLTAERVYYRWGPVAPRDRIPSLVDENGYFYLNWSAENHINPQQVELELRAQVDRALAMGVRPTHLDSHQYRLYQSGAELFEALQRVAHEYKLPFFLVRDWFKDHPYLEPSAATGDLVVDHTVTMEPGVAPEKWASFYTDALNHLEPGVTVFIIHLAFDDDEMRAATRERATWGAAWRQRDFDFFTSERFRTILRGQNIKLVTWRELSRAANWSAMYRFQFAPLARRFLHGHQSSRYLGVWTQFAPGARDDAGGTNS